MHKETVVQLENEVLVSNQKVTNHFRIIKYADYSKVSLQR